jgi:integrase
MPDNRRVVQVMLRTGLRVGDVLSLRCRELGRTMVVWESKTGKCLRTGLPDGLVAEIVAAAGGSEWAFPSPKDPKKHRTRQAVWKDIKRAQKVLRIPLNLGTHSARKAYASHLMAVYGDLEVVRRALNHENTTTTIIYAMADTLAMSALERRHKWKKARRKTTVDKSAHKR